MKSVDFKRLILCTFFFRYILYHFELYDFIFYCRFFAENKVCCLISGVDGREISTLILILEIRWKGVNQIHILLYRYHGRASANSVM